MSLLPESQYRKIENAIFDHLDKTGDQPAASIKKALDLKCGDSKVLKVLKDWRSNKGIVSRRGKPAKKDDVILSVDSDKVLLHNFSCSFEIDETIYDQFKLITKHNKDTTRDIVKKTIADYVNANKAVLDGILKRLTNNLNNDGKL